MMQTVHLHRTLRRVGWAVAALAMTAVSAGGAAAAQPAQYYGMARIAFPVKPIKLVVPFAPGGSTDIVARLVAKAMAGPLGQPVVVENKAGAGGMIGAEVVARSAPDGYTVGLGSISTLAVNPVVLKASRVDPLKDLQPVVPLASIASVFSVHPSLGVQDFTSFVQAARAHPGEWAAGSSGVGSIGHVILEALNGSLGIRLQHIPFKGMGPVVNSALAGQTQVLSDQFPSSAPHVQAGRLVPFAVAAQARLPSLPQVPTLAELGYPALNRLAITWFGLVVPADTPADMVVRLNQAANAALKDPALRAQLQHMGVQPLGGTQEALQHMVVEATLQVRSLVERHGITDGME